MLKHVYSESDKEQEIKKSNRYNALLSQKQLW